MTRVDRPEPCDDEPMDDDDPPFVQNSAWTLDDMGSKVHEMHQRIALTYMVNRGGEFIRPARRQIRPIDFLGVNRTICVTLLHLADSGKVVDANSLQSAFRAVDDVSDISEFLAACRRDKARRGDAPDFVEYETFLDFLSHIEASPTALYFWYDADDVLLYIGITNDVAVRHASHAKRSSWAEFADHWSVRRFLSREGAEAAEVAAIKELNPIFNRAHNDSAAAAARLRAYCIGRGRADLLAAGIRRG